VQLKEDNMKPDVSPDMRELTRVDGRPETAGVSFMIPDVRIQPGQLESTYILRPQQLPERQSLRHTELQ
jgi:hypothetical protein